MTALHVYPSALARDAAINALPDAAWTDRHITFTELVRAIDRILPPPQNPRTPIDETAAHGLLMLAARARKWTAGTESERALRAAAGLLAAWRGEGLKADDLRAVAASLKKSGTAGTIESLAGVIEEYDARLGDAWADRESAEQEFLARFEACELPCLPERFLQSGAGVELHGFHRVIAFQRRVLKKIRDLGHPLCIHWPFDELIGAAALSSLRETFGPLQADIAAWRPPAPAIRRVEAPSLYAEVYEIGRRVRRWIVDDGIAPESIGVAFRDLGMYSASVHDVFRRLQVPFHERRGEPASAQPIVCVALRAIQCANDGLNRNDLFRFLLAGPVDAASLAGAPFRTVESHDLQKLALDSRVDRFYGEDAKSPAAAWRARIEEYIQKKYRRPLAVPKAGAFSKDRFERHAQMLLAIVERLDSLRAPRMVRAHADGWGAFFRLCGLSSGAMLTAQSGAHADADNRRDRASLAAIELSFLQLADGPLAATVVTLDDFLAMLNVALGEQPVRGDSGGSGGVRVLSLYDLRGLSFQRVVVGGMIEGVFPAAGTGNPLLGSGAEAPLRAALSSQAAKLSPGAFVSHIEPRLPDESRQEELALFRIAQLAAASGEMTLTRPRVGADGRDVGPSLFWSVSPDDPPVESAAPIHPAPALADCVLPEETELRAAWVLGGGLGASAGIPAEALAAASIYKSTPKLAAMATVASVERARQRYFIRSAPGTSNPPPAPGAHDGGVALTAAEAPSRLSSMLLVPAERADALAMPGGGGDDFVPTLAPSALENLASCSFRFLTEKVWRFGESREPNEVLSPQDTGGVWHDLLARFYKSRIAKAEKEGDWVARLDSEARPLYVKELKALAEEVFAEAPKRYFIGKPGFWLLEKEKIQRTLETWIDYEIALGEEQNFRPAAIEFEFGPSKRSMAPALKIPFGGRTLLLEGRMDRLDLRVVTDSDGSRTVTGIRVIDYKLGTADSYKKGTKPERMINLQAAQLPIYLLAATRFLGDWAKARGIAISWDHIWEDSQAGYYSMKDLPWNNLRGNTKILGVKTWPLGSLREFFGDAPDGSDDLPKGKSLLDLIHDKVQTVLDGSFGVRPMECAGIFCAARYACRYQQVPPEPAGQESGDSAPADSEGGEP